MVGMRPQRRLLAFLGALTLVAACGAPAVSPSPSDAGTSATANRTPVTVKVGSLLAVLDSPFFLALERGYFAEQGITVDVQQVDTIAKMIPLLGTGQLDVALDGASSAGFFNAIARGIVIKMVANQGIARVNGPDRTYYGIVAAKQLTDSGAVRSPKDLKGRSVNVLAKGTLAQLQVATALQNDGISLKDVTEQERPFPDSLAGLKSGALAASFLVEPFITLAQQQGIATVLVPGEKIKPDREITDVFYSGAFAQKEQAATGFITAYLKGVRDYDRAFFGSGDRAAVVQVLIKHLAVKDAALYDRMGMAYIDPDGKINVADVKAQQQWYVDQGQVQQAIDVDKTVDAHFAQNALKVLGPYTP